MSFHCLAKGLILFPTISFLPGFALANASDLHQLSAMYTRARLCTLFGLILAAAPVMYASPITYIWTSAIKGGFGKARNWNPSTVPALDGTETCPQTRFVPR